MRFLGMRGLTRATSPSQPCLHEASSHFALSSRRLLHQRPSLSPHTTSFSSPTDPSLSLLSSSVAAPYLFSPVTPSISLLGRRVDRLCPPCPRAALPLASSLLSASPLPRSPPPVLTLLFLLLPATAASGTPPSASSPPPTMPRTASPLASSLPCASDRLASSLLSASGPHPPLPPPYHRRLWANATTAPPMVAAAPTIHDAVLHRPRMPSSSPPPDEGVRPCLLSPTRLQLPCDASPPVSQAHPAPSVRSPSTSSPLSSPSSLPFPPVLPHAAHTCSPRYH